MCLHWDFVAICGGGGLSVNTFVGLCVTTVFLCVKG